MWTEFGVWETWNTIFVIMYEHKDYILHNNISSSVSDLCPTFSVTLYWISVSLYHLLSKFEKKGLKNVILYWQTKWLHIYQFILNFLLPFVTLRISSVWNKLMILSISLTQISFRIHLACFKWTKLLYTNSFLLLLLHCICIL